ncbi:unnamed protein product, partial [Coregonus sp. 'balchen']
VILPTIWKYLQTLGAAPYFLGLGLSAFSLTGIGTGAGSSIFGFLTRSTAPEDRSTMSAVVMACRQAGLLIGPAFNIFLRLCDFQYGPFVVNKYTAPGKEVGDGEVVEEGEGEDEEGKPLIGSRHNLLGSYGSVVIPDASRTAHPAISNGNLPHLSPTPSPEEEGDSSPSKRFSMS